MTLTSITNNREWRLIGSQDSDGTGVIPPTPNLVTGSALTNIGDNSNNSRDSQLSQFSHSAIQPGVAAGSNGTDRFTWLVGGFYFAEKNVVDPVSITNKVAGPGGSGTLAAFTADQLTHSFALFANASYGRTDMLKLSLGGRYSREHKRFHDVQPSRKFGSSTLLGQPSSRPPVSSPLRRCSTSAARTPISRRAWCSTGRRRRTRCYLRALARVSNPAASTPFG